MSKALLRDELLGASLRTEHELLLAVAADGQRDDLRSVSDLVGAEGLDWEYVRRTAHRHGLFVLLHSALAAVEPGTVPREVAGRFRLERGALRLGVDASAIDLEALATSFEEAAVPMMSFKGLVLARRAYGDIYLRPAGDIDLLVRPEDMVPAYDLISARGYRAYDSSKRDEHITRERLASHLKTYKGVTFVANRGTIDLHATLDDAPYRSGLSPQEVWENSIPVEVKTRSIATLADEVHLRYLCFHAAKHAWVKLSWIVDVDRLVRSVPQIDWKAVLASSERTRSGRVLHLGLFLASRLLGTRLLDDVETTLSADPALAPLGSRVVANMIDGPSSKDIKKLRARLFRTPGERLAYVRHRLLRRYGLGG